jgi:hypothetical protein
MAWFRNHYHCDDCGAQWEDEWSCCCDDECPRCGSKNWSPFKSDDLTFLVEPEEELFAVFESPITAEHSPRYARVAIAPTPDAANAYISYRQAAYWD